jgi:glycosyltransferase involved in cell wall biosynthesis
MKILFLCNKSPWPPKEGGPMAMNMIINGLTSAGHQVKVLAVNSFKYHITTAEIPSSYHEMTGIELIEVDLRLKPADALLNLLSGKSYHVSRFSTDNFRTRLAEVLKSTKFDIVQLETLFMCPYIETIRKHSDAKIILRAHNIEHVIWQRIAHDTKNPVKRWYIRHLAGTLKNYEQKIIRETDGIVAITGQDAAYFRGVMEVQSADVPVIDIPFGLNPDNYDDSFEMVDFPSLFSLGSMNWIPNQEGIRWFLQYVWPKVHNQFPDLKYYLAGREMPEWMQTLKLPNVVVLGEVEDARRFLASKAIMVVPLFAGSGIRVKIIEGMAAGKTIISTGIGAEGIHYMHRENILIADTHDDFFGMISICVTNIDLCSKIGKQARMLIETEYDAKILTQKLLAFYQQVAG